MHQQVNHKTMGSDNLITNKERATSLKKNNKKMKIFEGKGCFLSSYHHGAIIISQ